MAIQNKIDFAIIITARKCNPNGDPLLVNMPRRDLEGLGEISDVCLKRKIRDRLYDAGENIIITDNMRVEDGIYSVKARVDAVKELKKIKDPFEYRKIACKEWIDVRAFGQVFGFKNKDTGSVSVSVRGPVSIGIASTLDVINVSQMQITKSINHEKNDVIKDSGTMGVRHIIDKGAYVSYGTISPQLASLTGFDEEDLDKIKNAIVHMFDNDYSVNRPSGSMECTLIWAEHDCYNGRTSSANVHRSFHIESMEEYPYFSYNIEPIDGVTVTVCNRW